MARRRCTPVLIFAFSLLVVLVVGCTQSETQLPPDSNSADGEVPAPPTSELRLAPGFYELEDGTAQALGTLAWSDLEGGFWVILDGTKAEGEDGRTAAVIANGAEFEKELKPLEGKEVLVTGKKAEGASIRMAGPEIEMESVKELTDTPGINE
jgi:hypothetical protein